jgi:hypothetical protein
MIRYFCIKPAFLHKACPPNTKALISLMRRVCNGAIEDRQRAQNRRRAVAHAVERRQAILRTLRRF